MSLSSFNAPYVHSNIYNFNSQFKDSSLDSRSDEGQERLKAQIQELTQLYKTLKDEADQFLGGLDWRTIMTQLNQFERIFREVSTDILNSNTAIRILSGKDVKYSSSSLTKAFPQIEKEILTIVDKNIDLSTKEAVSIISSIILKNLPQSGSFEAWKDALIFNLSKTKGSVEESITKEIKGRLSSEKGKITKMVEAALKSRTRSISKEKNAFIKYFETEFRARINQTNAIIPVEQMEEYLTSVLANFKKLKPEVFTRETSSMLGKLGEDFMSIVMNGSNNIDITFTVVGMETEESMSSNPELSNLLMGAIKSHHKGGADSQTDLLLTNSKTGKTVRVQSKNLQAAYHSVVDIDKRAFPGMARLQQETKYIDLINRLRSTGTLHLSSEELSDLSYILANEVWFRAKGNYPDAGKARGVSDSSSILGQTARVVEQLFAKEITNFMGITIDDSITLNSPKANSFNTFYLISNKVLFPTYLVLGDLINQLNQMQTEFSSLKVTLNTTNVPGSARALYLNKLAAVQPEGFRADGDYSEANLLKVGQSKGAEIMNSLTINNIGLKFNLDNLLKTSWSF